MKILFVCSSLEPGRDGVGDYTRRIAAELIRQGHFSAAIALNDKYISGKFSGMQRSEDIDVPVLCLPSVWPVKDRLGQAKNYINEFDPDWLSLQFVIFGYHPKGLPFGLGRELSFLGAGKRWHIMFHELWVGMEVQATKKYAIWGRIQRAIIKSLISALKPQFIHTHASLYQYHINKMGFQAQYLPLFSNIPRVDFGGDGENLPQPLKASEALHFVLFGHIHPNAPVKDFANEVAAYAEKNKVAVSLTIIGRGGSEQERWAGEWEAAGMMVNLLGEQPASSISNIMQNATMGISTTPIALIEKSGSVAAMHEHSLPVICVEWTWQPKNFKALKLPPGVAAYQKGNLEVILESKMNFPVANNVTVIAHQLVDDLLIKI